MDHPKTLLHKHLQPCLGGTGRNLQSPLDATEKEGNGPLSMLGFFLIALGGALPNGGGLDGEPSLEALVGPVEELTLENGWRFLLAPRPGLRGIAFETRVAAGSAQDPAGKSGTASLLAELTYRGSDRFGSRDWQAERVQLVEVEEFARRMEEARQNGDVDGEAVAQSAFEEARARGLALSNGDRFIELLEAAGGAPTLGFCVEPHATRFFVELPANRAELWCWLEAERFTRPVLRDFYTRRHLELEARRSLAPNADQFLRDELVLSAFPTAPWRRPAAGFTQDLAHVSRTDAERFFRRHYGARNTVTAIVGNFNPRRMTALLRTYCSEAPAGIGPTDPANAEPRWQGERSSRREIRGRALSGRAWRIPSAHHPDSAAIEITLRLLARAEPSGLTKAWIPWSSARAPGLAALVHTSSEPNALRRWSAAIERLHERWSTSGPKPDTLNGALLAERLDFLTLVEDPALLAAALAHATSEHGSWRALLEGHRARQAIAADDVQRVLARWFVPRGLTHVELHPGTTR